MQSLTALKDQSIKRMIAAAEKRNPTIDRKYDNSNIAICASNPLPYWSNFNALEMAHAEFNMSKRLFESFESLAARRIIQIFNRIPQKT